MSRLWRRRAIGTVIVVTALLMLTGLAATREIIALTTRANVTQSYFLTSAPKQLQAIAILFPGSGGLIQLRSEGGQPKFAGGNFLVRIVVPSSSGAASLQRFLMRLRISIVVGA